VLDGLLKAPSFHVYEAGNPNGPPCFTNSRTINVNLTFPTNLKGKTWCIGETPGLPNCQWGSLLAGGDGHNALKLRVS
jgi:hypothetical protein